MSTLHRTETDNTNNFTELFSEPGRNIEIEQKKIIEEMDSLMDDVDKNLFESVFTRDLFNDVSKMIEEEKLSLEKGISFLKSIGRCKGLLNVLSRNFDNSFLSTRFEEMIIEENEKIDGKNEILLADLCECYILLSKGLSSKMISICVPYLLKAALNKEENDETQKEVEIALLALSRIGDGKEMEQELFLNDMKKIIFYHKKHHNLSHLAIQSAWEFLKCRLYLNSKLEGVIMNQLHFGREVRRELEELTGCVDWKRKGKEVKEVLIIKRWLDMIQDYISQLEYKKEFTGIIGSVVQLFQAANDNHRDICKLCICLLRRIILIGVKVDDLMKSGTVNIFLKGIVQLNGEKFYFENLLTVIQIICQMLERKAQKGIKEKKRKQMKRKVIEMMEEEGYEDCIICLRSRMFEMMYCIVYGLKDLKAFFVYN